MAEDHSSPSTPNAAQATAMRTVALNGQEGGLRLATSTFPRGAIGGATTERFRVS